MRLHRGLWVGACLLLALAGCGGKSDPVKGEGSYTPIITGISSNFEPAARGAENLLTAQVTNVNGLGLTYHWSAAAGTFSDSTSATAKWTPPDSIGTYDVTVSIEAQDGETHYFKTMTVHMAVDNQFIRWTRSQATQLDPAPTPGGGVLYTELHGISTGPSDIYRVDTPLGMSAQLTTGFFSATQPTPRADQVDFAFSGKLSSSASVPTIYLLPFGGGDAADARLVTRPNVQQTIVGSPRFARQGTRLAYVSDSTSVIFPKIWWRDAANFSTRPIPTVFTTDSLNNEFGPLFSNVYLRPSWGPDVTGDGNPDSVLGIAADIFGPVLGITKLYAPDSGMTRADFPFISDSRVEDPDWSPDGLHIVFARRNNGSSERDIWIMNAHSTNQSDAVRVTSGIADDSTPRFNADGTKIFFISNRADHYGLNGIYLTDRRGTNIWSVAQFDRP